MCRGWSPLLQWKGKRRAPETILKRVQDMVQGDDKDVRVTIKMKEEIAALRKLR
jgi:hypothetical protein